MLGITNEKQEANDHSGNMGDFKHEETFGTHNIRDPELLATPICG